MSPEHGGLQRRENQSHKKAKGARDLQMPDERFLIFEPS
jgi:hypothetical protein